MCSTGSKATPYHEDDRPSPISTYGRSKREGEISRSERVPGGGDETALLVDSPMEEVSGSTKTPFPNARRQIRVVDDQYGAPTLARDLAQAFLEIIRQIETSQSMTNLAASYHLTASGMTTWYGLAAAIFANWASRGRSIPILEAIKTVDYQAAARRPTNSQLDCSKVARVFGLRLPPWQQALESCLDELIADG